MKKKKFLALAVATAIAGISLVGVTTATTTVTRLTGETVNYTLNGNEQFSAGIIEISGEDTKVYILDRNLGATATGVGCDRNSNGGYCPYDGTYGYYFQRGNNYGFKPGCDLSGSTSSCSDSITSSAITIKATWLPSYSNSGYFGSTFITATSDPYDYWSDSIADNGNHYDLRGGRYEDGTYSVNDNTWKVNNPEDRQGPCPKGFHVPSAGELEKIFNMLGWSRVRNELLVPFAGYRGSTDAKVSRMGRKAFLWSSSPLNSVNPHAYHLFLDMSNDWGVYGMYRADAYPIRCIYDSYQAYTKLVSYIEPTSASIQVTIGNETYDDLSEIMEVTTNNEVDVEVDEPVVGEVSVDFGENVSAKFNKLVQINIPVEDEEQVIVKVKHEGSSVYNFDGLTLNRNASCNDNGRPTSNQYNGEIISVVDGFASIYTCEASSFIALGLGSGEAIGEVTLTLTAGENTCTLNDYNLGTHNVSSEDQNVSTSGQDIVCEFLKNPGATIQLSMGDLIDGTKTIGRQYFTGIVTSLGNSLGTIANLTGGSYNFLSSHIIYTKQANTIGTWTGSLAIEGIIPAGTPGGQYTGELNVIICEGC